LAVAATYRPDICGMEEVNTFRYRLPIYFLLVFVVAIVAASIWGSGSPSSELRLLRDDPMSTVKISQASESFRSERDRGSTLGIQSPVTIERKFLPIGGASAADVANEAVEVARANGWVVREISATYYEGKRRIGGRSITLRISYSADRNDSVSLGLSYP
jgi:hypothetical protein